MHKTLLYSKLARYFYDFTLRKFLPRSYSNSADKIAIKSWQQVKSTEQFTQEIDYTKHYFNYEQTLVGGL